MGSATPTIKSGWPPNTDCNTPAMAVAHRMCGMENKPSVSSLNCSPNASAGKTEAKKMYVAGAKMCTPTDMPTFQSST